MNEENAKLLLFEVDDYLRSINFPYFLYGGTLLGAVRERKFIEIDKDVDIGSLAEDFIPRIDEINNGLREKGFKTEIIDHRHTAPWDKTPYALKFSKYGEHGDLSSWKINGDERFCPSHANTYTLVHPAKLLKDIGKIRFYDRIFSVPLMLNDFLTHKYGEWRTPHKKFYNLSRPGCRVYNYKYYEKGLTFGAFDMFHYGHLLLLENAKSFCKILTVCVSSKDYIEKYKGKSPIIPLDQRIKIVSSIKFVDGTDIQTLESDKKKLIDKHRPDVLFVGDDWTPDTYSGEGLGIPVVYLPHTDGVSSTKIRKIISDKNSS